MAYAVRSLLLRFPQDSTTKGGSNGSSRRDYLAWPRSTSSSKAATDYWERYRVPCLVRSDMVGASTRERSVKPSNGYRSRAGACRRRRGLRRCRRDCDASGPRRIDWGCWPRGLRRCRRDRNPRLRYGSRGGESGAARPIGAPRLKPTLESRRRRGTLRRHHMRSCHTIGSPDALGPGAQAEGTSDAPCRRGVLADEETNHA